MKAGWSLMIPRRPRPQRILRKEAEEDAEESESQDPHCRLPKTGHFANEAGEEEACTPIENITDGTNPKEGLGLFLPNTAPLAEDACPFKCVAGSVASSSDRTCEIPSVGKYIDADGVAQDCSTITGATFEENTGPVDHPNKCAFFCTTGHKDSVDVVDVNNGGSTTSVSARLCVEGNQQGLWNDNPGDAASAKFCRPIAYQSGWVTPSGALPTTDVCDYTCQAGYLKLDRQCTTPEAGKYVQSNGTLGGFALLPLPMESLSKWMVFP